MRKLTDEDFWSRVDVQENDMCWEWKSVQGTGKRGRFGQDRAYRVMWKIVKGPIPNGMYICHTCDNPSCVNPSHLFLGTPSDNVRDCIAKERWPRRNIPKGESHGKTKLSDVAISDIQFRLKNGETYHTLAEKYSVHWKTISRVARGKGRR
jgi:hypothetical protein